MDPQESLGVQFSNEVAYREFAEKARFEPRVEMPEYYREWDYGNDLLWISLPLKPETAYTLRLPAGLQDGVGNGLGKEAQVRFATGSLQPSVRMTTGFGLMECCRK